MEFLECSFCSKSRGEEEEELEEKGEKFVIHDQNVGRRRMHHYHPVTISSDPELHTFMTNNITVRQHQTVSHRQEKERNQRTIRLSLHLLASHVFSLSSCLPEKETAGGHLMFCPPWYSKCSSVQYSFSRDLSPFWKINRRRQGAESSPWLSISIKGYSPTGYTYSRGSAGLLSITESGSGREEERRGAALWLNIEENERGHEWRGTQTLYCRLYCRTEQKLSFDCFKTLHSWLSELSLSWLEFFSSLFSCRMNALFFFFHPPLIPSFFHYLWSMNKNQQLATAERRGKKAGWNVIGHWWSPMVQNSKHPRHDHDL